MYADYEYYSSQFGGSVVPEDLWVRAAGDASDRMDAATFGRLENGIPADHETKVKRCCCEMAEQIYSVSLAAVSAEGTASSMSAKASESIGAYSVTYCSAADGIAAQLHGESAGLEDVLQSIIGKHLGRTGLLYRGV